MHGKGWICSLFSLSLAAHTVDHMFSLYFDYLLYWLFPVLVLRVLIASVPDLCILFALCIISSNKFIIIFLFRNVYD